MEPGAALDHHRTSVTPSDRQPCGAFAARNAPVEEGAMETKYNFVQFEKAVTHSVLLQPRNTFFFLSTEKLQETLKKFLKFLAAVT